MMNAPEQAVWIGGVTGSLAGITTHTARSAVRSADRAAVFVPAPGATRTGPDRLHVRLARELAHAGIPSLRFDPADGGDSAPAAARNVRPEGDLVAAARQLHEQHPGAELVFIAFGDAARVLAAALPAIRTAALPCRTVVFVDPEIETVHPVAPRTFWQRLTGRPSATVVALAKNDTAASVDERLWWLLPAMLRPLHAGVRIATSHDGHARALIRNLQAEDTGWRRALRPHRRRLRKRAKNLPAILEVDGGDAAWRESGHWRTLVAWITGG